MIKEGMTISEATHMWVREFNAIQQSMISKLMNVDIDSWHEITKPSVGDRVYVESFPDEDRDGNVLETSERYGEVIEVVGNDAYMVELDDGIVIGVSSSDIDLHYEDDFLPMWGTMWSFGDSCDDYWLSNEDGIQKMSDCGFRIYEHDEWGYFFGIDGAGYDFHSEHWIPLYKAKGLQWHDEKTEMYKIFNDKGELIASVDKLEDAISIAEPRFDIKYIMHNETKVWFRG